MSSNSITVPAEYGQSENQNNLSQDEFYTQIHVQFLEECLIDLTHEDYAIVFKLYYQLHRIRFQEMVYKNKTKLAGAIGISRDKLLKIIRLLKDKNHNFSKYFLIKENPLTVCLVWERATGQNSKRTKGYVKVTNNHVDAMIKQKLKGTHYAVYTAILLCQQKSRMSEEVDLQISVIARITNCEKDRTRIRKFLKKLAEVLGLDYNQKNHKIVIPIPRGKSTKKQQALNVIDINTNTKIEDFAVKHVQRVADAIKKLDEFSDQSPQKLYDNALIVLRDFASRKPNINYPANYISKNESSTREALQKAGIKPSCELKERIYKVIFRHFPSKANRIDLRDAYYAIVTGCEKEAQRFSEINNPTLILEKYFPGCTKNSSWKFPGKIDHPLH